MVLSIEISESTAYAAVGKSVGGKVRAVSAREIALPNGSISGGMIKDKLAFVQAVNAYLATLKTRPRKAVVSVLTKLSLYKDFTLPIAPEAEMRLMVRSEMLQQINDNMRYRVDYSYLGRSGNMVRVMAYALPEEVVTDLRGVLRELHLKPLKLDVNSNCVNRLFSHAIINGMMIDNSSAIVADVGLHSLSCHLFAGGHMSLVRNVAVSILELERSLSYLGRGNAAADNYKSIDFSPENLEDDILLYDASKKYLGSTVEELLKIINYQASRKASEPVRRVYLYGAVSAIKGLPEYLSSTLDIPVERIETVNRIRMPAGFPLAMAAGCIGTILER